MTPAEPATANTTNAAQELAPPEQVRALRFRNDLAEIARLGEAIDEFGDACGLPVGDIYKVNLALDELLTNLISYAYPDGGEHAIEVHLAYANGRLTAVLVDDAAPFDPLSEVAAPDLDAPLDERPIGGLGLHFVRTLMDECAYQRDGERNRLTLVKHIKTADAG